MNSLLAPARSLALALAALIAAPAAFAQLTAVGNQFWTEESPGIPGESETLDQMGASCAAGDFNNDGFEDLAIGISGDNVNFVGPMETPMQAAGAGSVLVLYGSASGLRSNSAERWQRSAPVEFEIFGYALAAADFNNDGFADLAISAPRGGPAGGGEVIVLHGTSTGLTGTGSQIWNQDSPGILGASEEKDLFGTALEANDFNADGFADLAVGIPQETTANVNFSGAVAVLYGGASGLSAADNQFFTSAQPQPFGYFGETLASGDLGNDGSAELVVGESGARLQQVLDSGAVHVLFGGSPNGLTPPGPPIGPPFTGGQFGFSLAVGDFDNNGFNDIAIGSPLADNELPNQGPTVQGLVGVLLTPNTGMAIAGVSFFGVASSGPGEFSRALVATDFNNDGFDDLAGSAPRDHQSTAPGAVQESGSVIVFGGNARGDLESSTDFQVWIQGADGMLDKAEAGDRLGAGRSGGFHQQTLAAGDFNGDGLADLAIGVPEESYEDPDVGSILSTGGVHVLYGTREIPEQRNDWLQQLNAIRNQLSTVPVPQ